MSKILIIYASLGGNTELTCQMVALELQNLGHQVFLKRAEILKIESSLNTDYDLTILASPTYGQGEVEKQMTNFLDKYKGLDLKNHSFAIIGLGDTKFYPEYLSESASILESFVANIGGNVLVPSLRIGMPPLQYLSKLVPKWVQKIQEQLELDKNPKN
jgi:flavodoxin I